MNFPVPDFEIDGCTTRPSSSASTCQKNLATEDEIMEILWQNGQVVIQSQNQRYLRKPSPPPQQQQASLPENDPATHLFMQEDEMATWLHYPLEDPQFDRHPYAEFLAPPPPPQQHLQQPSGPPVTILSPESKATTPQPPITSSGRNIPHFARRKGGSTKVEDSGTSRWNNDPRDSTVVELNKTPALRRESRVSNAARSSMETAGENFGIGGGAALGVGASSSRENTESFELTMCSSSGTSGASATVKATAAVEAATKLPLLPSADRKRKVGEAAECHGEDVEMESTEGKKFKEAGCGSSGTKRSRAAEVHNLSERRRRDRINEKMKTLQELIPGCRAKSDKASLLDEVIDYLKSLQNQLQMMSMGCGMIFPGVQQYMASLGMGMGMNCPMMPFPHVLPGSGLPTPAEACHLAPRFPMACASAPDPSRPQASNQAADTVNSSGLQSSNLPRRPFIIPDPYQQYRV